MLIKIHAAVLVLLFFHTHANAMTFAAPKVTPQSFLHHIEQSHQQSYTQWSIENSKAEAEAHREIQSFSERNLEGDGKLFTANDAEWDQARLAVDLNNEDREILALLAEKQKESVQLCRLLLEDPSIVKQLQGPINLADCERKGLPLPLNLQAALQPGDVLCIDGRPFLKEELPKKLLAGKYRWQFRSNQYADVDFIGTAEEMAAKLALKTLWVEGDCKDAKLLHPDFRVLTQAQIYFALDCTAPGLPPVRNVSTWAAENKTWLWGIGIVLAGFTAYQLRDKNLIITTP